MELNSRHSLVPPWPCDPRQITSPWKPDFPSFLGMEIAKPKSKEDSAQSWPTVSAQVRLLSLSGKTLVPARGDCVQNSVWALSGFSRPNFWGEYMPIA